MAGILRDRMIFNLTEEDWDDGHPGAPARGTSPPSGPASAYWREQRNPEGHYRVINFTSVSGLDGSPGQPNYAAAKMGIVGLTYSLRQRAWRRYGVTANAIAPGAATRLTATVPADKRVGREERPSEEDPRTSPDNIAPVALYLASERSDWLTGRVISSSGYRGRPVREPADHQSAQLARAVGVRQARGPLERSFRPAANGLPRSLFASQLKTN